MKGLQLSNFKQLVDQLPAKTNLQLIATTHSTTKESVYSGRMVAFKPYEGLVHLASDIVKFCTDGKEPLLSKGSVAQRYDGSGKEGLLSYLDITDPLVGKSWTAFSSAMSNVSREQSPSAQKISATVLTSVERDFFLVSIQTPILSFNQRRLFWGKESFSEIGDGISILTFTPRLDAIVFREKIVFLSSRGASFFVSESAVLRKARETASRIAKMNIVSNIEEFMKAAEVPRNAHWLIAVDEKRLENISKGKIREHVSEVFGLKYSKGQFSTSTRGEIAALLKVLGKRGMLDVVENIPVEVSGSGDWKVEA